jgi:calcineurin-like phosphoesterase family protein
MNYIVSDTHIGHYNIIKFENIKRPFNNIEEHDQSIIDAWNSVIKDDDIVYHLGDVFFRKENFEKIKLLKGRKRLILGNHDHYVKISEYEILFEKVLGSYVYNNCILTHIPVHTSQFPRFDLNIHGHSHSAIISDLRYINVSLENLEGLKPVLLDKLIQDRKLLIEQCKFDNHNNL